MADLPDYYTMAQISEAEAASFKGGLDDNKSDTPVSRQCYLATDTKKLYYCVVDGDWIDVTHACLLLAGGTMSGDIAMGGNRVRGLADPALAQDAATRAYVLSKTGLYLPLAGGTMAGAIAMGANKITGLANPTNAQDAATKAFTEGLGVLYLLLTGGTMAGNIAMGTNKITGLGDPVANNDAAHKLFVIAQCAARLLLTGGTLTGDLSIEKATPTLFLKDTAENGQDWKIESWAYAGQSWFRITYIPTDQSIFLQPDGQMEIRKRLIIATSEAVEAAPPVLMLECVDVGDDTWQIFNDRKDLEFTSDGVGAIHLKLGMRIKLRGALVVDHTSSGTSVSDITAGENLVFGDAVYMKSDGKAWKSDADEADTMPIFGIAVATIDAEATGEILTQGWIRDDSWSLTAAGIVYASVTPGAISTTAPVGAGDQVQVVGIAKTTHLMHFNPSYELVEIS